MQIPLKESILVPLLMIDYAIMCHLPGKLSCALIGALVAIEACMRCGYLSRIQAASAPGYDPPNAIHFAPWSDMESVILVINVARSASAC